MNSKFIAAAATLAFITACSGDSKTPQANEPDPVTGDSLDTDGDGTVDTIDTDDDNDGFLDVDDVSPLDQTVPGDFSSPEAILNQTVIRDAIDEASAQGFTIQALTGLAPPDIGGYYHEEERTTVFVATDTGEHVGNTRSGAEFRYDQLADNTINGAVVNYDQGNPTSYSISSNSMLRGTEGHFTRYSRSRVTCTIDQSDFSVLFVGISTAQIDSQTLDFVDRKRISISVGTFGEATEACNDYYAGGAESVGGWSASEAPRIFRTEPSQFQYMCVDDDRAFSPTESWVADDGRSCSCTKDYVTSCQ